jgi:hypothetical protein
MSTPGMWGCIDLALSYASEETYRLHLQGRKPRKRGTGVKRRTAKKKSTTFFRTTGVAVCERAHNLRAELRNSTTKFL